MSSAFGGGRKVYVPKVKEPPQTVTDDKEEIRRRMKRKYANASRQENLLYGISQVLKKRLGE